LTRQNTALRQQSTSRRDGKNDGNYIDDNTVELSDDPTRRDLQMEFTRMRVQRDALEHKCELFAEEENVRMQANKVSQERMTHLESCCRAQRTQLQTLLNKSTDHERQQREERIEAKQRSIDEPVDAESLPGKLRKLEDFRSWGR